MFKLLTNLSSFWVVRRYLILDPCFFAWFLWFLCSACDNFLVIQYFLLGWHCTWFLVWESIYWKYSDFKPTMQRNGIPQERIQLHISIYFSSKAHITLYEASASPPPFSMRQDVLSSRCLSALPFFWSVLVVRRAGPGFPWVGNYKQYLSPPPSIHQTHLSLRLFPVCPTQHLPQHPKSAKAAFRALGGCLQGSGVLPGFSLSLMA